MSHLLVVTRPALVSGYRLAGVEAFAAKSAAEAQQLIAKWLDTDETGLLAVDEAFWADFDSAFLQRLAAAEHLPHMVLPGERPDGTELTGRSRIASMLRQAIGFHITFQGEQ
ncbi:MAG: hypothetical protein H6667_06875 [Ardenticatenaceae bacterium]|nr:hypothetical protein [Ardenticatenaceae bacterium]MCB9445092.1 hypothetical protein [Ardenticatenaceae bacterium]